MTYRDQLDFMSSDQRAEVPLICYEIVDYHYPRRVMRSLHGLRWFPMHVILVWTYTGSNLGGMITHTGGHNMLVTSRPANRDTRLHGYQPAGVDRRMIEVDDMASVVIQQPPTDPSQMTVFAKKTFSVQPSRRRLWEHLPDRGARGVKRGARRQLRRGAGGGRPPVLPVPNRHEHADPAHVEVERGEGSGGGQPNVYPFDSPNLDIPSFSLGLTSASQSLPSGYGTLQTPPHPGLGLPHFKHHILHPSGFLGFVYPLLWAEPVHLHRINLYRMHLRLMKRSRRMTWMVYSITDSGIVLVRRLRGSCHPIGLSYN
ncbi:hypothetical protein M9H77_20615 [Catharanthus roseus]|uniref:Uncharacterized protein n=1 Tax=Catharanthus roseus TaxID=4058 RepID=A0ACC0AMR1_CATRO|nr:hypothetical protein M9H77_20615 [Catharanthus roseus]